MTDPFKKTEELTATTPSLESRVAALEADMKSLKSTNNHLFCSEDEVEPSGVITGDKADKKDK